MRGETTDARCSRCGREGRREDMFGAEPDLLCETCATRIRERTAPSPTGRVLSALVSGRAPVTLAVVVVSVLLFVASKGWAGSSDSWPAWIRALAMAEWTGTPGKPYLTVIQEPWRLLTSAFLHLGVIHILFNLWWIWDFGRAIEFRRGTLAMAALVIGSAVGANSVQWIFSGPGVGLSGVVFALAGFLFVWRRHDPVAAAVMNPRTTRLFIAWFFLCIVLTQMNVLPIGNWAHGGGAVWGLLAGMASRSRLRVLWTPLLGLATAALVVVVMQGVVFG